MTQYDELLGQIERATGRECLELLDMLARAADANHDVSTGYNARSDLCELACTEGFPEKAIVAFSWCLAAFDNDPTLDAWRFVLWRYKNIIELLPIFARVSRAKIIEMQDDMARRLLAAGESERTAHYYRSWNYMRMGDYEQADAFQETYLGMRRSGISDCLACERDRQVELLSRMRRDEECLRWAEPIMRGSMRCAEIPHFTNGHIVRSQMRLGRLGEATQRQASGYALVRRDRKYLGTIGDLMLVLIHQRQFDDAVAQMVRHLPWAVEAHGDELRCRFYHSCGLLMEALAQVAPQTRKLRLPRDLGCWREDDEYDPMELAGWFAGESRRIADLFNARNGNDHYDELLAENRMLARVDA